MKCFDPFGRYAHTVLMVVAMLSLAACGGGVSTSVIVINASAGNATIESPMPYVGRTMPSVVEAWRKMGVQVFSTQCGSLVNINWPQGDIVTLVVGIEIASSDVEKVIADGLSVLDGNSRILSTGADCSQWYLY